MTTSPMESAERTSCRISSSYGLENAEYLSYNKSQGNVGRRSMFRTYLADVLYAGAPGARVSRKTSNRRRPF